MKYSLGALPSGTDRRDHTLAMLGIKSEELTEIMALYRPQFVYNQGRIGQCVAFSAREIIECMKLKETNVYQLFSNSFIYGNRRPTEHQGEGMYPRDALKNLLTHGVCEHDEFDMLDKFPVCNQVLKDNINYLFNQSIGNRLGGFVRLYDDNEVCAFIKNKETPIMIVINVYQSFFNTPSNGIVTNPTGDIKGGHAMIQLGFMKLNGQMYRVVQNSWGEDWGSNGLCFMPLTYPVREMWGLINETAKDVIDSTITSVFMINSKTYWKDGVPVQMDVAPYIKTPENRTMLPVRFVAEAQNMKVKWQPGTDSQGLVIIKSRGNFDTEKGTSYEAG